MIGYYTERRNGELLYSSTARACDILFPDCSSKFRSEQLLGDRDLTIGALLPNNGRRLLTQLPPTVDLDDDSLLDGSVYHILSPFSSNEGRRALRESAVSENAMGKRGMLRQLGRRGSPLQYCLRCALRDAALRLPQIWCVVPNFPGVNCCDEHGCLLVTTNAVLDPSCIHSPSDWINLSIDCPASACEADVHFAADVRWVYELKSAKLPGFQRVGAVVREALLRIEKCQHCKGRLSNAWIAAECRERMESTVRRLDPALLQPTAEPLMRARIRYPFARYWLLARLANMRMKEVFHLALAEPEIPADQELSLEALRHNRVGEARRRLAELVAQFPDLGRKDIIAMDESATDILRRNDHLAYEAVMPPRRRHGRNSSFNWNARDLEVHTRISDLARKLGDDARSMTRVLVRCGLPSRLFEKARGRLPWSQMLVASLVDAWRCNESKQTTFRF